MARFETEVVDAYIKKFQRVLQDTASLRLDKITDMDINERKVKLASSPYPSQISAVNCEVKVDNTGGHEIMYIEEWGDKIWACRWDRHKNSHNTYEHFHCPPDADGGENTGRVVDADYPQGILVMETVGDFIADRYNDLITSDSISFPADYDWENEYGGQVYDV